MKLLIIVNYCILILSYENNFMFLKCSCITLYFQTVVLTILLGIIRVMGLVVYHFLMMGGVHLPEDMDQTGNLHGEHLVRLLSSNSDFIHLLMEYVC